VFQRIFAAGIHIGEYMKSENNPYNIVRMFEDEIANYTGAPYAVSCDSCTNAIFLCLEWLKEKKGKEPIPKYNPMDVDEDCWIPMRIPEVTIPRRTYLSVPQSIIHAGFKPVLEDIEWCGEYQLKPLPVWDSAKRFTSGMYRSGQMQCLSFHIKKHLKLGKGGMILTDDPEVFLSSRPTGYTLSVVARPIISNTVFLPCGSSVVVI
jgi:dTDP-4-amino-4,6-dideoxygalactose transaminase